MIGATFVDILHISGGDTKIIEIPSNFDRYGWTLSPDVTSGPWRYANDEPGARFWFSTGGLLKTLYIYLEDTLKSQKSPAILTDICRLCGQI